MSRLGAIVKHVERRCGTCRWYIQNDISQGECVRYPPTVQLVTQPNGAVGTMSVFPPTQAQHVCGEWQPGLPEVTPPADVLRTSVAFPVR